MNTTTSFSSTSDKQQSFHKELKQLLAKYDAELSIVDFGHAFSPDNRIITSFGFDDSFYEKEGTGIIPDLILGTYQSGR